MKDVFDVIIAFFGSISWPLAAIVIVITLKKPIGGVFNRIRLIKIGDAELHLAKVISEASAWAISLANKIGLNSVSNVKTLPSFKKIKLIAEVSPFAVIIFSYSQIEKAFIKLFPSISETKDKQSIKDLRASWLTGDKIDEDILYLFYKLEDIYDTIFIDIRTAKELTKKDAMEYGKSAEILVNLINSLREEP